MVRAEALDLLSRLKASLIAGSLLALGMFAALAATHVTGVTSRASSSSPGGSNSQAAPASTVSSTDSGSNFFNQSSSSGFGIGPPGSQAPSSSTSVS